MTQEEWEALCPLKYTQEAWEALSPAQKKEQLYKNQKEVLDLFLERRAISPDQYQRSLTDLRQKMGMEAVSA